MLSDSYDYYTAFSEKVLSGGATKMLMARAVQENYALYDGFIICHGTDTLAYSAAALSYLIQNADKPIILTGAQQPISNEITDAKKNLRDSVICALDPGSRASGAASVRMTARLRCWPIPRLTRFISRPPLCCTPGRP